ncbi:MAG: hypothetical protein GXO22_06515 [Aquificae bacterium]|nr:hypothetical protein [Aquificota bacterium]
MKKDKFKIIETNHPEYRYIIEPTMYISITRYLPQIAEFLKLRGYKGKVIFDNGLITGDTVGRFIEAYFNGKTFDSSSFITMVEVPPEIKKIADQALEEIKKSITKPPETQKKKPTRKAPPKQTQKTEKSSKPTKTEKPQEEK